MVFFVRLYWKEGFAEMDTKGRQNGLPSVLSLLPGCWFLMVERQCQQYYLLKCNQHTWITLNITLNKWYYIYSIYIIDIYILCNVNTNPQLKESTHKIVWHTLLFTISSYWVFIKFITWKSDSSNYGSTFLISLFKKKKVDLCSDH